MIRKIIKIDEGKCNGCGLCASACHEGAIEIIDGKAKLVRENFCDGLGDCLPGCPTGAITFEERDALEYDESAVLEAKAKKNFEGRDALGYDENAARETKAKKMDGMKHMHHEGGCPGSRIAQFHHSKEASPDSALKPDSAAEPVSSLKPVSRLGQWPCQIKLVPIQAPFFEGAQLLIAADCTAFAYADMHEEFMKERITIIGCPKLDDVDYTEKLTAIIRDNDIRSVTIARMEVPCCGGLQRAAENALRASGKFIPWQVVTISRDGHILR